MIFTKPEYALSSALADVEKFIAKFDKAAKAAAKEQVELEDAIGKSVNAKDDAIEKAYDKYMKVEREQQARHDTLAINNTLRQELLADVIAKANSVSSAFRKTFGL